MLVQGSAIAPFIYTLF
ncbi:MAG: DUF5989 family protein [Calditrichia bacterium]